MSSERVIVRMEERICWLTLNRPEIHNAMDSAMQSQIIETLQALDKEQGITVVVIRGSGKSFCSGADLKSLDYGRAMGDRNVSAQQPKLFEVISNLKKVVVASVHGVALGGGLGIVAASDLAIASEDAIFGLPEIDLGYFPMAMIGPIMRSIGRKSALELFFTGRRIDAKEAKDVGLVNSVVPRDRLEESTLELAKILASKDADPIALGKEALAITMDMEYSKVLRYSAEMLVVAATLKKA